MNKRLVPLNLPRPDLRMARKGDQPVVWDTIRQKYLKLTPEEWVRQHLVHYLISLDYPQSAIALEGGFKLYQQTRRTDILVYKSQKPQLIVECKAPQVKISQATFDQALQYNLHYKVPFILISNGLEHYAARVMQDEGRLEFFDSIPRYDEI
ncbi:MAG TPA: restriction endonuclease subunit R [Cryomorphaceae bacterium]|nr:restriction endonuclease subunit R [Owenweeksia sp.]MBF97502.1 restriction endonuclease subunit R [Owenweeksia sp.]HAD96879.1 restriction endonuclease subunit R [Cryomorphaceae bacterium]HBF19609.1 restriction endonuclease subunit R [Cryomorphaceae bacterium]